MPTGIRSFNGEKILLIDLEKGHFVVQIYDKK